jgi:hypothetical protein
MRYGHSHHRHRTQRDMSDIDVSADSHIRTLNSTYLKQSLDVQWGDVQDCGNPCSSSL